MSRAPSRCWTVLTLPSLVNGACVGIGFRGVGGGGVCGGEVGTKGHGETKHRGKEGEEKTQSASIVGNQNDWYQPAQLLPTWPLFFRCVTVTNQGSGDDLAPSSKIATAP